MTTPTTTVTRISPKDAARDALPELPLMTALREDARRAHARRSRYAPTAEDAAWLAMDLRDIAAVVDGFQRVVDAFEAHPEARNVGDACRLAGIDPAHLFCDHGAPAGEAR